MNREVFDLLDQTNFSPSLNYWSNLLNAFDKHKETLSIGELCVLANESERCRKFWNKSRMEIKQARKNGKDIEIEVTIEGLGIEKEDVHPNIHKYLDEKLPTEPKKTKTERRIDEFLNKFEIILTERRTGMSEVR
jgi:hypothetical protein